MLVIDENKSSGNTLKLLLDISNFANLSVSLTDSNTEFGNAINSLLSKTIELLWSKITDLNVVLGNVRKRFDRRSKYARDNKTELKLCHLVM